MTACTLPALIDPTNTVPCGPNAISRAFSTLSANTVTWNPAGTSHCGCCARPAAMIKSVSVVMTFPPPIGELQHSLRQPLSRHVDPGRALLDVAQVARRQRRVHGAKVLLEARQFLRPRNRDNPRLLREQPRERDLRRRRAFPLRDPLHEVDHYHVCRTGVRGEARRYAAKVFRVERRRRVDRSGEKASAQRTERNEADAKLLARRQHAVALRVARPQRVFALHGGRANDRHAFLPTGPRPVDTFEAHAAVADGRNDEVAGTECPCLHPKTLPS